MAWNQPGGGKKNPWDRNDDGSRSKDLLDQAKKQVGRIFGGGGRSSHEGGARGLPWILLALIAFWLVFDCWQLIDERERGVVLRFGKVHRVMMPGPNFKWPRPVERVIKVDATQVRNTTTDQVRMLTKDENIVIIDFNVQYRVLDPQIFLFGSRDPEETLKQAAESAVREIMGGHAMDEILTGQRAALAADARAKLQKLLETYRTGLEVTEFNLQNARPPAEVKAAFDDAISAREDKQRYENEALAYASQVVPQARGQAARIMQQAQGEKESQIARAAGDAERFSLVAKEYRAAPEVTRRRMYLEVLEEVMKRNRKVLVDTTSGNNVIYLPLGQSASTSGTDSTVTRLPDMQAALPATITPLQPERERITRDPRRSGREEVVR